MYQRDFPLLGAKIRGENRVAIYPEDFPLARVKDQVSKQGCHCTHVIFSCLGQRLGEKTGCHLSRGFSLAGGKDQVRKQGCHLPWGFSLAKGKDVRKQGCHLPWRFSLARGKD